MPCHKTQRIGRVATDQQRTASTGERPTWVARQCQGQAKYRLTCRVGGAERDRPPPSLNCRRGVGGHVAAPTACQVGYVTDRLILAGGHAARIALQRPSGTGDSEAVVGRCELREVPGRGAQGTGR